MANQDSECLRTNMLALLAEETGCNTEQYLSFLSDSSLPENPNRTMYANLLKSFVHLEFTEEEAIGHWKNILENRQSLKMNLGRNISVHLALVDYFTNIRHMMTSPMLIEIRVFQQTERLAMVDGLTGVFNRRYMDIVLKKEFNRCDRYGKNLSVCMIDIDNFKKINDSRGHIFGDHVLRELALLLKDCVREEDIVCRYGGEEFLIIMPETDPVGSQILAERIRMELKNRLFFTENGITFSGGTANYPLSAADTESLLKAADRALYQAKFTGKDRIVAAAPERRKFGRYPHSWVLDIFTQSSRKPITGIITQNVSLGGIQFECPIRYTIDTPLHLIFTNLETNVPDIEAEGRITWVKKNNRSYTYGINFVTTPELFESKLTDPCQSVTNAV